MNIPSQFYVHLSPVHSERFGMTSAKCYVDQPAQLNEVYNYCRTHQVKLLMIRCPTNATQAVQSLENNGARLMDTIVYFSRDLRKYPPLPHTYKHTIRLLNAGEEIKLAQIAAESFAGYPDQYRANSRLDPAKVDEIYYDWAYKSCFDSEMASAVFVAADAQGIYGFVTTKSNGEAYELVLNGVRQSHHNKGVYNDLVAYCIEQASRQGANHVYSATSLTNTAVQKVWIKNQMAPEQSFHMFHQWLDL